MWFALVGLQIHMLTHPQVCILSICPFSCKGVRVSPLSSPLLSSPISALYRLLP